jgi:deoxyribose-phosphate aldolase
MGKRIRDKRFIVPMVKNRDLASYIDHTLLKPDATYDQIRHLCREADEHGFKNVCINPCYVPFAKQTLKEMKCRSGVCTVIAFPLGALNWEMKGFEAELAVEGGADEIDMVMNIGAFKSGDYDLVRGEIEEVVAAADGRTVKVIIETNLLTDEEKKTAAEIVVEANANFVKTCTGWNGGVKLEDVRLLREVVGDEIGIKASGGIKTAEQALALIEAGATRIGSSSSVEIVRS